MRLHISNPIGEWLVCHRVVGDFHVGEEFLLRNAASLRFEKQRGKYEFGFGGVMRASSLCFGVQLMVSSCSFDSSNRRFHVLDFPLKKYFRPGFDFYQWNYEKL